MKKITLLFPTLHELVLFKKTTHSNYIAINEAELTLVCECSETDIRLAIQQYKAVVINPINAQKNEL